MYDKEHYEKIIDESPLFSLDKEKQRSQYSREAMKMVESLYCYLMTVKQRDYESFGMEIVETAKRCIENYDAGSGRFLNYFHSAWKQNYRHLVGRTLTADTFQGLHFSEDEERNFRKYIKLARSRGIDTESPEFDRRVKEAMGLTEDEIELLRNMLDSRPVSGISRNEEGEEYSLIDQLDSGLYTDSSILQLEKALEFLDVIEMVFDHLQDRQKPLMSCMITSKLSFMVTEEPDLAMAFKEKTYYQEQIYEECIRRGVIIQAKEIAEQYGITEASLSRTWRKFKEKLNQMADRDRL